MNDFILTPEAGGSARGRHPTLFAAAAMYLFAGAGIHLLGYILRLMYAVARLFAPEVDMPALGPAAEVLYYAVFCVLPVALYAHRHPGTLDSMRVNGISPSMAALCALAAVAGVFFVTYLTYLWVMLIEVLGGTIPDRGIAIPEDSRALATSILMVGVIPGICEEVLFRGAILGAWERRGTRYAMLVSTVLFMGLHGSVSGMPTQFVLGLIMAFLVVSTNSLFAGVIYHTVHNSASMILAYVSSNMASTEELARMSTLEAVGGFSGIVYILIQLVIFGGVLCFLLRAVSKKRVKENRRFGIAAPLRDEELDWQELTVICAGAVTVGVMYMEDFLAICGVIS